MQLEKRNDNISADLVCKSIESVGYILKKTYLRSIVFQLEITMSTPGVFEVIVEFKLDIPCLQLHYEILCFFNRRCNVWFKNILQHQ